MLLNFHKHKSKIQVKGMYQQRGTYPPDAFFGTLLKSNALMFVCSKHIPSAENLIALQTPHSVSTQFIFYSSLNADHRARTV